MMPGATFSPRLNFTFSLPSATTLVAKSCDIATVALGPGTATAWGLVPRRRAAPPQGATFSAVGALTHSMRCHPRAPDRTAARLMDRMHEGEAQKIRLEAPISADPQKPTSRRPPNARL